MIPEISKKEIRDFIFSSKKQVENSDFVKELVGTPFSDCTIEELRDELIDYTRETKLNKKSQDNLNVLISDYFAFIKSQRDFDINEMQIMLEEKSTNYNKGKAYILYTDDEHREELALSVYKEINEKKDIFSKAINSFVDDIVMANEFDENFEAVCRKLFPDTKITQIFDLLQKNFTQYGKEFLKDNDSEKLDEISVVGDKIREKLKEELKSEFDKAIITPEEFEL